MKPITNRLRRIEGQVASLHSAVNQGHPCHEVLPQFLAVKGALDAALSQYLKLSLVQCKQGKSVEEVTEILDMILKKLA